MHRLSPALLAAGSRSPGRDDQQRRAPAPRRGSQRLTALLGSGFCPPFEGAFHRARVSVGRRPEIGLARCGLRSGMATRKHAELVPLWVGKYDPALIACLADVGVPGT